MNYDCVFVFHKMTSLASYFASNERKLTGHLNMTDQNYERRYDSIADRYTKEQDVRLILLVRYERNATRTICKINCPVSPLPVKGEFEAPSLNAVKYFLIENGWTESEALHSCLLE